MILDKLKTGCIALLCVLLLYFIALTNTQKELITELEQQTESLETLNDYTKLAADKKLGLAKIALVKQEELTKQYLQELSKKDKEFEKFRKKHKLQIKSRDQLIAKLLNDLAGGSTIVEGDCIKDKNGVCKPIKYTWSDNTARFKLIDPDIWTKNNEQFSSSQYFKLKGEIFADKTGGFKTRKIQLQELYDSDPAPGLQLKPVPDSQLEILENDFSYVKEQQDKKQKSLLNIFTFKPLAGFDTSLLPSIGFEFANLGRYFDYANIGLYSKIATDLSAPLQGSIENSRIGIGLNYHIVPPLLPTNFAVGASLNFPFNDLRNPLFTADIIFYLTEDLNPFIEK